MLFGPGCHPGTGSGEHRELAATPCLALLLGALVFSLFSPAYLHLFCVFSGLHSKRVLLLSSPIDALQVLVETRQDLSRPGVDT